MAVVVAAGVLGSVLGVVPAGLGLGAGVAEAQSAGPAGASSYSAALLHRTVLEEGQTRQFQISGLAAHRAYYVFFKPLAAPYTAEAGDVSFRVPDQGGLLVDVAAGSGARGWIEFLSGRIDFVVEARSDADSDDETFGVRLCTTADCTGGTVLGDWTVTVDDVSDTTVTGTGVSVTVSGGHTTVMERSLNTDSRDRRDDIEITLAAAPTEDIVILGKVDTEVRTGGADDDPVMEAIARPNGSPASGDITDNPGSWFFVARFDSTVGGQPAAGEYLTRSVELVAQDNVVDSGDLSGTWSFRVVTEADADEGDRDSTDYQDNDAYSAISLPSLPVTVTGDDEPTEVFIEKADTADNIATEADTTDTAKFKVRLSRALEAGEWIEVPLASRGADLGAHFALSLDGAPQGVTYAASSDGTLGLVRFTGPSAVEATVVVTAASDDGNSVTENVLVHTYRTSEPSQRLRIDTNLDAVCSGEGCGPGRYGERVYRITLQEASDGLRIIDDGDRRLAEAPDDGMSTYEYEVRLNTPPSNNVTLTTTTSDTARTQIASDKTTLTFTPSNWDIAQTMRVFARRNSTDEADQPFTVTHAFSGDATYTALADVTHDLVFVDNDATTVAMAGTGVRMSPSGTEISEVMVEGDASRVDRSLTISLSRALEAGEYARVPLYLEAVGHSLNPDTTPCDLTDTVEFPDNADKLPADLIEACNVVDSVRGPRYSANVAWPVHYNDFDMAASGIGVSVEAVNRRTPPHAGFRWLEFRGAGARAATIELNARDGFDDGESFDEQFSVRFPNNLVVLPVHAWAGRRHLNPDTNLSGGIQRAQSNVQAWYGIADDEEGGGSVPEVPADWPLVPSDLNPGDSFRLLYVTSQTTTAQSGNLAVYDAFVRAEITGNDLVNGGVAALADHAGHFKAVAETVGTTARDHAQFSPDDGEHPDVPVYWVGGAKVADDNADFADGTWGDEANPKHADGTAATVNAGGYWTGSGRGGVGIMRCDEVSLGRRSTPLPRLGEDDATVGLLNDSGRDGFPLGPRIGISSRCGRQHGYSHDPTGQRPMYALSGEFTVAPEGASVESAAAAEGSAVMFAVTIPDAAPAGGITVPYSLSDGRGIAGELAYAVATGASGGTAADYDNDAGSVVIAQGQTSNTFAVSTTQDSAYEGDHFFTVTLGTPTGANPPELYPNKSTATGTITDAADLPTVAFSSAAVSAGEGDGTVDVTVARTGATLVPSSVFWTTADGTASHPGDYTAQSGTLEFAAGDTSKTLTVGLVDDDTAEGAETFMIQLDDSQATAAQLGGTAETTVTVTDDDGGADGVTLSASDIALTELGSSSAVEKTYTVVLDTDPGANVTVTVASGDPTAVAVDTDSDTAGNQSTLTFTGGNAGNWSAAQTVTLRAVNDGDAAAETVTVSHTAEVSTDSANPYHGIDIADVSVTTVDAGHAVVVSPAEVSFAAGGGGVYEMRLASDPGGAVTVGITVTDGFIATTDVSAVAFDSDDWNEPQQVTVTQTVNTGSTTITHAVTTATTAYPTSLTIAAVDVSVTAAAPVTVTMAASDGDANGNAVEGQSDSTGYRTVTVTLGRALAGSEEVTVPLSVVGAAVTDDFTFGLEPATQTGVSLTTTGGTHTAQNPAVVFGAGASSATLRLKPADNSVRSQPYVVVRYGTGALVPAGSNVTLGAVSGGPVGVVFVDDETGDFEVAADWPLLPSGLSGGDEFRLMFLTSQTRGAGSQVIDVYNEWAQGVVAAGGHAGLKPYGSLVRVVGSTSGADARVNTGMRSGGAWADGSASASDSGVAVYWLAAPPTGKVADNYFDFYDGDWDGGTDQSGADTVESGAARTAATAFWTGSDNDGTKAGNNFRLGRGMPRTAVVASGNPLSDSTAIRNSSLPMLVMSPVFKVEASTTGAPVSVAMSASDGDSDGNAVEGGAGTTGYRTVTLTLGRALAASEEVTVPLSVAGATVADDFTFGLQPTTQTGVTLNTSGSNSAQNPAVVFASGAQTATLRLTPVDNNVRTQPYVIVDYGTGAREPGGSGGVTLGAVSGGPVGVVLVDDESGDIVLPPGTAFRPAVFNNAEYRLMFMTSAGGAATSTDIADYDHFVRAAAVADGVEGLLPYVGFFKAFVSTASVDGREHVGIWDPALRGGSGGYTDGTTRQVDQGTGIRWLHGETAASDYFDACSRAWQNRWSSSENYIRHEDGSAGDGSKVWTGMNNDCTTSSNPLGTATPTYGPGVQAGSGSHSQALSLGTEAASSVNRFYAVSDAFKSVASAAMPAVELTSRSISGNEGDAATARLRVSPAPTDDLTVTYSLSEVAATAGEDFTAGQATVTVPAGQTSVSFDVAILQDNVFEDSETFRLTLVPSPDYLIGTGRNSATSAQVTILDDEILKVGFAQSEYWAREDGGSVDVDLTLSHHTEQAVNLMLAFGGTATDGSDYTAPSASVRIPAGNTSGTHTVTIPITADATQEPDETIVVSIDSITMSSRVSEANRSETTVFIADEDHTTPGLVVPATVEVDEGGTATYWLRLATAPSGTVTVTVSGQTAATLTLDADDSMPNAQNSVQFDASNWFVGRKVTVRGVHDADLTDDSVTLAHSASGADYGSVTGSVTASVDDEDVTLSITPGAAVTEGTAAEFTVTANPAPERDLTVNVGIADASGADFVAANQQGNRTRRLSAGQSTATFTVPTVADFNVEPSGPITITLRTSDHYRIDSSAASAEVQVNDDDAAAVAVAMSGTDGDADGNAVEGASNSTGYRTITLTLGGPLSGSETLTVPLSVTGATVTTDYTFALQPPMQTGVTLTTTGGTHTAQDPAVVFTAGATTATLRLTPVDNNVRSQPYVIVDFGSGATASGGINVGEQTGGPINVVFVDDETGDIEVAADWALAPSGLSAGDEFRLIFITSQFRTATSTDIDDYNDWARLVVAEHGHAALLPYSGMVSVIGSTTTVDARENTAMWDPALNSNAGGYTDSSTSASGAGTAVYWLAAPSANKVADNYFDFYDASWDTGTNNSNHSTDESGGARTNIYWTGSSDAGVAVSGHALGESPVRYGHVNTSGNTPLNHGANAGSGSSLRLLAMSPVFKIDPSATGPEVSVRLMVGEGENRNADGEVEKPESDATVSFPVSLDTQPATDMTVCVQVSESGDTDRVAPAAEGIKTVSFMSGVQTGSIDVAWTDTADDDLDSVITVTAVPSNTVGCTSSDVYTVSGAHGSEKVRVTDDEATVVTLTSSDTQMQEQDASDTATLTVSSGRALVAGESLVARITLATSTMARLPDHATPDFAVTATGTGVVLTSATSATPLLRFTGSDGSTVQTATVTLTPTAADDADTADETVTAALSLITGTGSGTVVTGGGVEVGSSSTATLTIDDDDTSNCAAQNTVLSVSDLRVTEMGGVATYCVRLTTAPSGGQTTVAVGTAAGTAVFDPSTFTVIESVSSGAATVSPSSLTFTASNYTEPQQVTVTATDEPGDNRNRRFNLTHTASGGGYSSQALGAVPVLVTDAPELEVFEYRRTYDEAAYNAHKRAHDGWGIFRPNTLTSTPGLGPAPDITPGQVLDYFVRLSAQPAGEVEVTINVTDVAGYDADTFTGISFTPGGSPQQSLTFTFHDGDPTAAGCSDGRNGGDRYTQTRISWKCYRVVWVHNTRSLYVEGTRCADVVHSATGGGFRTATVPTMRAFSLGMVYGNWPKEFLISQYRDLDSGSFYRLVYFSKQTPGGPYTWHMRPWSGGPLVTADTLNLETVYTHGGQLHQPADCPLLRRQYTNQHTPQNSPSQDGPLAAQAPPEPTTAVANLTLTAAGGASVDVVWDAVTHADKYLVAYSAEAADGTAQSAGVFDGITATAWTLDHGIAAPATVTVTVTPGYDTDGGTTAVYLDSLAATAAIDTGSTAPSVVPEIAIAAGADVTEGGDATFTVTASPAPAAGLDVIVEVAQSGDFASTGTQTVTIPTSGTYTLVVATANDDTDEADGTITATVNDGAGYSVSGAAAAASVAVSDNDPPPDCVSDKTLELARDYYELNRHRAPGYGRNWRRVLIAFGDITDTQLEAFTAAEARQSETRWAGWRPFREALECIEQAQQDPAPPPAEPEIAITAGNDVAEGSDATFTITAAPAPAAGLDITVEVAQTGDFATTGTQTITIPTSGAYTLVVATADDSTDEPDGSVTATIEDGTGYSVSTANSAATVNVSDDDDPPPPATPEISIAAGTDVTEGGDAVFTITADPKPHADLDVAVEITQSGAFVSTGARTVTIGTTGTATLTVATTDDNTDEADGSVTATVSTGTGYTISSSSGNATVAVADDDIPEITITAGTDVTEGGDAIFTITADPAPHSALSVDIEVTQTGEHGAATGTQTVTIPATGTYTLTVATADDSTDEADGSVTATVSTGTGYTVSSSSPSATVNVSDDDPPPAEEPAPAADPPADEQTPTGPLTVTVSDATASEGDTPGLRFVATLSRASTQEIKLGYGAFDITAEYNRDYTIPYRTFTIKPGETQVEIVVPVIDDNIAEGDETLTMYAYDSTFTHIEGFAYATGTITDDD